MTERTWRNTAESLPHGWSHGSEPSEKARWDLTAVDGRSCPIEAESAVKTAINSNRVKHLAQHETQEDDCVPSAA